MRLADYLDKGASLGSTAPCLVCDDQVWTYADVVLLIVDATHKAGRMPQRMSESDAQALHDASKAHPLIVALNKVDRVGKPDLLPVIEAWTNAQPGVEVVPISAVTGDNVDALERVIAQRLPAGPPLFPHGMVTDRSPQFIAQEIIREQLYHQLGKELPYACAVQVETWTERFRHETDLSEVRWPRKFVIKPQPGESPSNPPNDPQGHPGCPY